MGCDYYIYSVLKIIHKNGVSLLKLSEKPVYLYDQHEEDTDEVTIHPSKRRAKVDHMKPECDDVLIYKKGEKYISKYMELIEEFIKYYADINYETKNKIIINHDMHTHESNGESLKCIDDIDEIHMIELRAWRN
jgi:uncharacterized protein YaaR (DUF327 family)